MDKPIRTKPSLYAWYFDIAKQVAVEHGWNLVLHGSMARDCDLIMIPWVEKITPADKVIENMAIELGGTVLEQTEEQKNCFPHNRQSHIINIKRGNKCNNYTDDQYYIDISVILPTI